MSKRKFFYDSIEDAQRRLSSSVVLLDGDPVLLMSVTGLNTDQIGNCYPIPYKGRGDIIPNISAPLNSSRFSVRNLPRLGYVDYKDYSYYLMRIPSRQGKQGYCRSNVQILNNPLGGTPNWELLMSIPAFKDMFLDRYPRFDRVFDQILSSETPLKRSFGKNVSLEIDDMESVSLEHRGMKVAVANNPKKFGPVFRLPKKFQYLSEELQEYGVKVE